MNIVSLSHACHLYAGLYIICLWILSGNIYIIQLDWELRTEGSSIKPVLVLPIMVSVNNNQVGSPTSLTKSMNLTHFQLCHSHPLPFYSLASLAYMVFEKEKRN